MKKKTKSRRHPRVSGINVQSYLSPKVMLPAGVTVAALTYGGEYLPDQVNTETGAKVETVVGLLMAWKAKNPMLKGVGLGLAFDGGKKWTTGTNFKGDAVTADAVAGLWYTGQNPAGQFNNSGVSGGVRYGR